MDCLQEAEYDSQTGQRLFQPVVNVSRGYRDLGVDDSLYKDAENRRMRPPFASI